MNSQHERTLAVGLKALADRTRNAASSPHVERAVLAEMARLDRARTPDTTPSGFIALAAGLLIAVGVAIWSVPSDPTVETTRFVRPSGFVELPNVAALPAMESASIVRVSLPPSVLPQYGMPIVPEMTGSPVEAELLVAQDGQPRAIRLVPDTQRSKP